MKIHKEGYKILIVLFVLLDVIGVLTYLYVPAPFNYLIYFAEVVVFILVLQFFRDPKITLTLGENLVVAPADGKVVVIEETEEPECLKDRRKQISIFMSPLNVHINRMPVSG
ncbi:MAG: phosphatidylserine decarboxylase, partial [Cyclobacteriaceae bacterium]|nr:phosphatidylserine decarboxylase [Cyclobacteriaceae bacterium]